MVANDQRLVTKNRMVGCQVSESWLLRNKLITTEKCESRENRLVDVSMWNIIDLTRLSVNELRV